jgi:sugar/nucleoside kinase (ribokinase family)
MNEAETLGVELNVLAERGPKVPDAFADSETVFLANTHPALQRELLAQVKAPKLTVCDSMNLWIANERDELLKTLAAVDGVIINDGEARQLTNTYNLVEIGHRLLDMGPRFAVIKKGEHGALLFTGEGATAIPAFPTQSVVDPTGAGDSFAGGMLGYLTEIGDASPLALRRAIVRGTVAASFTIESFSINRAIEVTRDEIEERVGTFLAMLRIE